MATERGHDVSFRASQLTPNPVRIGGRIPNGHIVVSEKWRGSDLVSALQGSVNVLYEDDLGVVDFHPSTEMGVVYITEGDMVAGNMYRRKLAKLRKANNVRGVIIAERTQTTNQYFGTLQKFAVLDLGLVLIPITTQTEAAQLLSQMVHVENRPQSNQFRVKRKYGPIDGAVLSTVQQIPKLGEVKAKALLERFHSIQGICDASPEALASVVGKASAAHIQNFFTQPPTT